MPGVSLILGGWLASVTIARLVDVVYSGYLGPNTVLPLASILAASVGVILMFWGAITKRIRKVVRRIRKQPTPVEEEDAQPTDEDATGASEPEPATPEK